MNAETALRDLIDAIDNQRARSAVPSEDSGYVKLDWIASELASARKACAPAVLSRSEQ